MSQPVRVLVVDDSALMRKLIPQILHADNSIQVVGTALDGSFALKKIEDLKQDMVLNGVVTNVTHFGAFVVRDEGIEALPIGSFFRKIHASVFVPSGFRVVPQVPPEIVFQALGSPADRAVFFWPNGAAAALPLSAFVPLETSMKTGTNWLMNGSKNLSLWSARLNARQGAQSFVPKTRRRRRPESRHTFW